MGNLDAYFQYFIFSILLPSVILFFLVRWYFDLKSRKISTWIEGKFTKWVHGKLENEKKLLFGQMNRMRFGNSLSKNPRLVALNVLEIGVGGGRNFSFYPEKSTVTCLDPNPYQESYVKDCLKAAKKKLKLKRFVRGFAEEMTEIKSDQFDIAICTLTLCSVRNVDAVLEEVRRVLKPGGKFFFLEHVAGSENSLTRWIQNRLAKPWAYVSSGCCLNRETWTFFEHSNFSEVSYQHFKASMWLLFVRSWMYGVASK